MCEVPSLDALEAVIRDNRDWFAGVKVYRATHLRPEACIVQLRLSGLDVEIFGQPVPVHRQVAFRHMIVEGRLLER